MRHAVLALGLLGVASAALWARLGLDAGSAADSLAAWRLTIAGSALGVGLVFRRSLSALAPPDLWRAAVAGLFLALHFATWIASLSYVSVARSTLLVSTSPLWAGLAGLVFPALRPAATFWLGLGCAGAGTALFTTHDVASTELRDPSWLGDLLAIVGAICIVPYLLISQRVQRAAGTLTTIFWINGFAAMVLLLWLLIRGELRLPASGDVWISVIAMAVLAQLIGHGILNWALRHFSAAQVAASTLLEPVFAAALAYAIFGERVTAIQGLGAGLLLIGVGVALRQGPETMAIEL